MYKINGYEFILDISDNPVSRITQNIMLNYMGFFLNRKQDYQL